jgi:predicted Zn-dependent protease
MGAPILAEMSQPLIPSLEKLIGTARDGALLRYSLGNEYLKAGDAAHAIEHLREAVKRDPDYSAAWKLLGRALADAKEPAQAIEAWGRGVEAARRKGDRQAEKEMTVFSRRLARSANRDPDPA